MNKICEWFLLFGPILHKLSVKINKELVQIFQEVLMDTSLKLYNITFYCFFRTLLFIIIHIIFSKS